MTDKWIFGNSPYAPAHSTLHRSWFNPAAEGEYWYRAQWGTESVYLEKFLVRRITPKGVWVQTYLGEPQRFIRSDTRKQWASPTEAEAVRQLLFRTTKRISILQNQLKECQDNLALFEKGMS